LRAKVWSSVIGNGLALSKGVCFRRFLFYLFIQVAQTSLTYNRLDTYKTCLARARRSLAAHAFPSSALALIEEDILTTLPNLHIFHPETGPLYGELKDLLCAWVVARGDEGLGYVSFCFICFVSSMTGGKLKGWREHSFKPGRASR